jgi:capsular polysaccharide biosynthesis protein
MSEPLAADSTVDAGSISPDSVGDRSTTAATKTRPMRVRKLRAKAAVSHKINPDRPTLRLKASSATQKAPSEPSHSLGTEADAVEGESFKLIGASDLLPPAEQPASPKQIEIPELRPSPRADFDESHAESPNDALQEAAATLPPIDARSARSSQMNGSPPIEPAGIGRGDLIAGSPPDEAQVQSAELQARQEAPDAGESLVRQEQTSTEPELPVKGQDHWHSPALDVDPRFTYVPQQDNRQFPIEELLDSRTDVAEPDPVVTNADDRIEAPIEAIAAPRKLPRLGLRTQLVLLALAPILVGSVVAFLFAWLSPTLYAARSEIVVNVASMDWSRAERFLATQLVVAKARTTLGPISESTKVPLRDLEKDVKAELIGSSDVIDIQYANSNAGVALEVVKAVTAQYLLSLRDYEQVGNGRHRLLMPATLLEEPVSLKPIYAAFIGAIVGIAIGILGIMLRTQAWRMK